MNSPAGSYRKRFVGRLRRESDQLFTFLEYGGGYTDNISERGLRCIARMRKISYGGRSDAGIMTTETLMSICTTCRLRGINVRDFVRSYLDGETDRIPMPAAVATAT